MKSKIKILTIVSTDRGIGDRWSGINGTILRETMISLAMQNYHEEFQKDTYGTVRTTVLCKNFKFSAK